MMTSKPLAVGLALTLALFSSASFAGSRNCTKAEKLEGNQYLLAIESDAALREQIINEHLPLGVPSSLVPSSTEELLVNGGYVMLYDHDLRTSLWSAYHLTATDRAGASGKDRVNCFRSDPRIEENATRLSDYKEPIYDQGHLTPDASLKDEFLEQINSYVLSNMSPQQCALNRGVWLSLEGLMRQWAYTYQSIYIISGAIFDADDDGIRDIDEETTKMVSNNGKTNVSVPSDYYKVVVRENTDGTFSSIVFMLPNNNQKHGAKWAEAKGYVLSTVTTLATLEDKADIHLLPDVDRANLHDSVIAEWDFQKGARNMEYSCK
jgi:endonuclease G